MKRIQLALNVDDVEASTLFYSRLLGVPPAKTRPGYANFLVEEPSLKLVLLENPGKGGSLNHLGVEVGSEEEVHQERERLAALGLASREEEGTCCYARQSKFWVENTPHGEEWEVYTVLGDSQSFYGEESQCCPTPESAAEKCC